MALLAVVAFVAAPSFASADGGTGTPTLSTDQLSYAPGATADLSGNGFVPGDTVVVTIADSVSGWASPTATMSVAADGSFTGAVIALPSSFDSKLTATATDTATGDTASAPVMEALPAPSLTPTITTDQTDYAPGSVVTITGAGWPASDTVSVATTADDNSWSQTDQVTTDASGDFTDQLTLPLMAISSYTVTAKDASGLSATTSFTDASVAAAAAPSGVSYTLTYQGFTNSTCTTPVNGGNGTAQQTTVTAGTPFAFSNNPAFWKLTAGTATAPSGATFSAWGATGGGSFTTFGPSNVICALGNPTGNTNYLYTATYTTLQATALTAVSGSGTYGGTASLTATLKAGATPVNNESIGFKLNGTSVGSATTNSSGVATLNNVSLSGINAGTYPTAISASFAGDSSFAASGPTTGTLTVAKATPGCSSIAGYTVTYDGKPHTASGFCLGVDGTTHLSGLDLSGTTHTNAGTYNGDPWTFTDTSGNYNNASGTVNDKINQAGSATTVSCAGTPFTYNGSPQGCTASWATTSTDSGGGSLTVSYTGRNGTTYGPSTTAPTNAGDYTASASFAGDNNHTGSNNSTNFTIQKAGSAVSVPCSGTPFTYNGNPHSCIASWATTSTDSGGGPLTVTYTGRNGTTYGPSTTAPTNAGDYTASASFAGDNNHTGSNNSTNFTIQKAGSATTVACAGTPFTYNGSPQGCTASWATTSTDTGGGSLTVTYTGRNGTTYGPSATAPTNAGDYTASASFAGDSNHTGSNNSTNFTIGKATLIVTSDNKAISYGDPLPTFTYKVTGFKGSDTSALLTGSAACASSGTVGSPPGPAGSYTISCTQGTLSAGSNYTFSFAPTGMLTIGKKQATLGFTGVMFFSTGSTTATTANVTLQATVTPASGGSPDLTKAAPLTFLLYKSTNLTMTTPDATCTATSVSSAGVASCMIPSLGIDNWTVIVQEPSNSYFTASDSDPTVITVYQPATDEFATGGGWVIDPSSNVSTTNKHGNFGFTVRYKNGTSPSGQAVYVFRGSDGYDYVVKSNSWSSGGLSFGTNTASFSGKCTVTAINPANGAPVSGIGGGNYTFRVDVTDNGTTGDTYAISVYTPTGTLYHQAGTTGSQLPLGGGGNGGGNITVHIK